MNLISPSLNVSIYKVDRSTSRIVGKIKCNNVCSALGTYTIPRATININNTNANSSQNELSSLSAFLIFRLQFSA